MSERDDEPLQERGQENSLGKSEFRAFDDDGGHGGEGSESLIVNGESGCAVGGAGLGAGSGFVHD